ncbi:AMP-binding protein [Microbacterium sp.]|uniref:AMP-binding protein n=1 Tax=Microbacterium sp. TaxID=51671 RepID=UPI0025F04356|nr:AMP-binding protein [Microbacterium sp.]
MNETMNDGAAFANPHSDADRRRYYADGWWQDRVMWDFLVDGAMAHPERVMLTDGNNTLTYGSLREKGIRLAAGLAGLGVGRGDRVAVQMPNWAEFGVAALALSRLGAVLVPIMPIFRGDEVGYILEHSGAEVLIGPATFHKFGHLDMYLRLREAAPALREIVMVRPGATVVPEGVHDFEELFLAGDLDDLDAGLGATAAADDPALLVYTSGTTARPKGCVHSFNTMHGGAKAVVEKLRVTADDVVFNPSPVAHSTGLLIGLIVPLLAGAGSHFQPEWDPEEGLRRIETYGCTMSVTAATFLSTTMQAYEPERHDMSGMRLWGCAGAPIPGPVVQQARALFPETTLIAIYGRSENFASTMTGPDDPPERAVTSDGRATPGSQVRILDDADNDVPVGSEGDVAFKGPSLMLGYYRDPAAMAEDLTPDGFHLSGDLGYADEAGFVRITGRVKDIIIRGGLNISAREVEDLLAGHPDVLDVAVVSMPDPRLGEKACAFVVPRHGAEPTVESLGEYLRAHDVAVQKLPERVELVDSLPRTAPGKVRKNVLRDMIAEKLRAMGGINV